MDRHIALHARCQLGLAESVFAMQELGKQVAEGVAHIAHSRLDVL